MNPINRRTVLTALPLAALLPEALINTAAAKPASADTVYELRIYHAMDGKLDAPLARFRDHTNKIFAKHHMRAIAYWTPTDDPAKTNTLIYILEHPSREAAKTNWKSFEDDEEWKAVKAKSEENGKLVDHVDSTYMALTTFSPHIR
jgi:NIPSNAP protein